MKRVFIANFPSMNHGYLMAISKYPNPSYIRPEDFFSADKQVADFSAVDECSAGKCNVYGEPSDIITSSVSGSYAKSIGASRSRRAIDFPRGGV